MFSEFLKWFWVFWLTLEMVATIYADHQKVVVAASVVIRILLIASILSFWGK